MRHLFVGIDIKLSEMTLENSCKYLCVTLLSFLISIQCISAQSNDVVPGANYIQEITNPSIGPSDVLFSGMLRKNNSKNQVWYIPNAFELFPANTIEGFVLNPQVTFTQNFSDGRFLSITPNIRYGLGNQRFQTQLNAQYFYNPKVNGIFSISGGRAMASIFEDNTLSALNNTLYTFAFKQNYMKVYERFYLRLRHAYSPLKNLFLSTALSINDRTALSNLSRYNEENGFLSNAPENLELEIPDFDDHVAMIFDAKIRWQLDHRLVRRRGALISEGNSPGVTLSYSRAINNFLGGDVSYQKIAFSIEDEFVLGSSNGGLFVETGGFLSKERLTFIDFKFFKGKRTVYGGFDIDQFHLLDYYNSGTSGFYVQGHYEHSLKEIFESQIRPIFGVHYLYTDAGGHYAELGLGMKGIFKVWRVDLYKSLGKRDQESFGLRVGIVMD